jgi:hypothetical protein
MSKSHVGVWTLSFLASILCVHAGSAQELSGEAAPLSHDRNRGEHGSRCANGRARPHR